MQTVVMQTYNLHIHCHLEYYYRNSNHSSLSKQYCNILRCKLLCRNIKTKMRKIINGTLTLPIVSSTQVLYLDWMIEEKLESCIHTPFSEVEILSSTTMPVCGQWNIVDHVKHMETCLHQSIMCLGQVQYIYALYQNLDKYRPDCYRRYY